MNKAELLQELSVKISTGEMSREEVLARLGVSSTGGEASLPAPLVPPHTRSPLSHFSITKMLYVLGAAVAVVGIIIFVAQVWNDIGSFGRITVTLGLGLLFAATGSVLLKSKPGDLLGSVFHAMGGLLIPGGVLVTLAEWHIDTSSAWPFAITFGVLAIFYLLLNFVHKNAVLTFFIILHSTLFLYLLVTALMKSHYWYAYGDAYAYLTMVIGISYLLLAHAWRDSWNHKLVGLLSLLGIIFLLGAGFSRVFESVLWQMLYVPLVMGGLLLAVYLKNRAVLVISTLFLIMYVTYITSKYFADSIGWPITLILLGFVFIALGYTSININKKYIAQ